MEEECDELVGFSEFPDGADSPQDKSPDSFLFAPQLDPDPDRSGNWSKKKPQELPSNPNLLTSLVAGAVAGIVVDFTLFPLDTLKTRLQSKNGFRQTGGFRDVYKGIVPAMLGSAPTSALFFATYNTLVNKLKADNSEWEPMTHVFAASLAEIITASIRVPIEVVKQRKQVSYSKSFDIIKWILQKEGVPGMYRGFLSTITREVPFAAIQFSLWELLKIKLFDKGDEEITPFQTAICGALAGGISAAMTTPMDVVKTRTMLADLETINKYKGFRSYHFVVDIIRQRGLRGLFAGVVPRVLWITLGGFIYFGVYDKMRDTCEVSNITLNQHEVYMQEIGKIRREEREREKQAQIAPSYAEDRISDRHSAPPCLFFEPEACEI